MNADEIGMCLRLLAGHWPTPAMGQDEVAVWNRTLYPLDFETAFDVIDKIAETGVGHRPTDGALIAAYRQRRARQPAAPSEVAAAQLEEHTYPEGSYEARIADAKTLPERIAILREQAAALPKNSWVRKAFEDAFHD